MPPVKGKSTTYNDTSVAIVDVKSSPVGKGAFTPNYRRETSIEGTDASKTMALTSDGVLHINQVKRLMKHDSKNGVKG